MSVKRPAICGTLGTKVRHIYDVVKLYQMQEIKNFLIDDSALKELVQLTKNTDSFYLGRRNIPVEYDPTDEYAFDSWKHCFNAAVKSEYEKLHRTLQYSDEKQDFAIAVDTFEKISERLAEIGE